MKVLVTGAGGYIGRHVVTTLLNLGVEVIATDFNVDEIDSRATKIKVNILSGNPEIYSELLKPDVCLHMAWKDGFVHNSDAHMAQLSQHYIFLKNMLEGGLKHIAVMGTMHEVGYFEGAIDENTPCNPISMYGIAKDALRRALFNMTQNKPDVIVQWLRAYYIYGDDKKNNSIFAKIIRAEEEGKETFPFTTGKNKYDFIHVDKLAECISKCVIQDKINGIINCCTGEPISLADQVENFIKQNGYKIKLEYGAFPDRAYDSPATWGDASKIKEILTE